MNKEIRSIPSEVFLEDRLITGYAVVFNKLSEDLGGFREQIDPNALNEVIERSDIFMLLDHKQDRGILARSRYGNGSLLLEIDNEGLKYMFDSPKTNLGDEALEAIKRKDVLGSSFAFTVGEDKWERLEDGTYLRTILSFDKLYDCSIVYTPAYSDTSVATRSLNTLIEKRDAEELEIQKVKELELKKELDEYYSNLRKSIQ